MTDLAEIEKAWCEWMRRFRGNRSGEPAPVTTFAAGGAYERARIRRELLEAIGEADARSRRSLSAFHGSLSAEALRVLRTNIETAVDKIVPEEG